MEVSSIGLVVLVVAGLGLLGLVAIPLLKKRKAAPAPKEELPTSSPEPVSKTAEPAPPQPEPSEKVEEALPSLPERLSKTRGKFLDGLGSLFKRSASDKFSEAEWDTLEEGLIAADVGVKTTTVLLDRVRERAKESGDGDLRSLVRQECEAVFAELPSKEDSPPKPLIVSIVGVNGVGKTTTIGKLANLYTSQGKKVLLGAADTFRAGAISQLKIWADRVGVQFVSGREGGDPGAVAFDATSAGKARGMDVVILDTAGRLHTKSNLMDELVKVNRVVKKVIPDAPHEIWLVLDGTLGQNSVRQAAEFGQALNLTGVIVTKLDGTAKGGAILSVATELQLPVRFIGLGEGINDLIPFKADSFLDAVFGTA